MNVNRHPNIYIYIDKVEQQVEFAMEYFASFGTALVPTMGLHKAVLHVLAKRYAIYPKARQNNDTLAISFKTYFRPKKMYQFEKKSINQNHSKSSYRIFSQLTPWKC